MWTCSSMMRWRAGASPCPAVPAPRRPVPMPKCSPSPSSATYSAVLASGPSWTRSVATGRRLSHLSPRRARSTGGCAGCGGRSRLCANTCRGRSRKMGGRTSPPPPCRSSTSAGCAGRTTGAVRAGCGPASAGTRRPARGLTASAWGCAPTWGAGWCAVGNWHRPRSTSGPWAMTCSMARLRRPACCSTKGVRGRAWAAA